MIHHACYLHLLRPTDEASAIPRVSPDTGIRSLPSGLCILTLPRCKGCEYNATGRQTVQLLRLAPRRS
jgi:hypothetical protein